MAMILMWPSGNSFSAFGSMMASGRPAATASRSASVRPVCKLLTRTMRYGRSAVALASLRKESAVPRAATLFSGATESSRSMTSASAPQVIPLANFFGLSAGTKSSERMFVFPDRDREGSEIHVAGTLSSIAIWTPSLLSGVSCLRVEPSPDLGKVGDTFKRSRSAVGGDQHGAWYFALPLRIDFIAKALDEVVSEHPIVSTRSEAAFVQHGPHRGWRVGHKIGIDGDEMQVHALVQEPPPLRHLRPAWAAGDAPEVHDQRLARMRSADLLPGTAPEWMDILGRPDSCGWQRDQDDRQPERA